MCELFGVSSPEKIHLNTMLETFFSHGKDHPHGWGMAFFHGNAVSLEKQPQSSVKSDYLKQRLRFEVVADLMMAHIRYATKGTMEYENTHPFVLRDAGKRAWTLAHNGTIFDCDILSPYLHVQKGRTDSERIFLYLLDCINAAQKEKGSPLSSMERFQIVDHLVREISPGNKVNLLLFDGLYLYVHINLKGSLHYCRKGRALVVSTQPLDEDVWKEVPINTLYALEAGELKHKGKTHDGEFFETEEKMQWIFSDYAAL